MSEQRYELHLGDCLESLRGMADNSVDSIVTDPPYGLSFMGKKWDYDVPSVEVLAECLRVLKPGGHLLAFAGTRTQHRMAVRIEDAGFEIRDMIAWVYGSGFPKSLDVSKAIDRAAGVDRPDAMAGGHRGIASDDVQTDSYKAVKDAIGHGVGCGAASRGTPITEAARQWQGWGTALKPALEPITVARKPLVGTVAENVLAHGTGALNIDGCRVGFAGDDDEKESKAKNQHGNTVRSNAVFGEDKSPRGNYNAPGRWPANLIHDGSDEVVAGFPQQITKSTGGKNSKGGMGKRVLGTYALDKTAQNTGGLGDEGTPARFFYCAKASKSDRGGENNHPTVKPTDLMRYLCLLVTPPGGVVLDPFMGSGSTGKAAMLEGFNFVGCEREAEFLEIARGRIEFERVKRIAPANNPACGQPDLFGAAA